MHAQDLITAYYQAFNEGRTDDMLAMLADDVEHHVNEGPVRKGKELFAQFNAHMTDTYRENLTDMVIFANQAGDRAAAEFVVNGTYLKGTSIYHRFRCSGPVWRPDACWKRLLDVLRSVTAELSANSRRVLALPA